MDAQSRTRRDPAIWDRWVNDRFKGRPVLSPEDSIAAARKLYRHAMGRPWKGEVKLTSGNRYTWVEGGVLYVNPNRHGGGLREIVHLISHYAHRRLHPRDKPHSIRQARLERKLATFAIERGWHEGQPVVKLRAKAEKPEPVEQPKPDKVAQRYHRMVSRRDKWKREAERAKRLLAKAEREVRQYERRHGERVKQA